jgi:hypothetical protein
MDREVFEAEIRNIFERTGVLCNQMAAELRSGGQLQAGPM